MDDRFEKRAAEVAVGPRVTKELMESKIKEITYYQHGLLTLCVIDLVNGFHVTGESACAYPANFNEQLGKDLAYSMAFNKIGMLEGYLLKEKLYTEG